MPSLPELSDDLVGEILLRIPPEDPGCLLRASLVCKRWRHILCDPAFRRRQIAFHPRPAVIGFFTIVSRRVPVSSRFIPIGPASPAARDFPGWLVVDCRHGRALFLTSPERSWRGKALDFIVWDPLTNDQHRLPRTLTPNSAGLSFNAAVLCAAAADDCDHSDCHGGPFRVVFIYSARLSGKCVTVACVYSSESGNWGNLTSVRHPDADVDTIPCPAALVGDALYFCGYGNDVFEFQLATRRITVIDRPGSIGTAIFLMPTEDGKQGFAAVEKKRLCLWSRETSPDGVGQWAQHSTMKLKRLLPDGTVLSPLSRCYFRQPRPCQTFAKVVGFAEGTDVIFVGIYTDGGAVYMVQLKSGRVTQVLDRCACIFPFTSFCNFPVMDAPSTANVQGGVSGACQTHSI